MWPYRCPLSLFSLSLSPLPRASRWAKSALCRRPLAVLKSQMMGRDALFRAPSLTSVTFSCVGRNRIPGNVPTRCISIGTLGAARFICGSNQGICHKVRTAGTWGFVAPDDPRNTRWDKAWIFTDPQGLWISPSCLEWGRDS